MANPPKNVQNLIDSLKVGIARVETGGSKDPYSTPAGDKNKDGKPDSTAMGKYQFLKSFWWDTKYPINGVKQFAKGKEDVYGKISSWEDFSGNAALQEAYFTYYAKNHLIPEAQKAIANGNPKNLTLDQAAAVIHKEGFGNGRKVINSGKLSKETDTNVSDAKYLEVFSTAVKEAGFKHVSADEYVKNKMAEEGADSLTADEKKLLKSRNQRKEEYRERDAALEKMADDGVDRGTIENERRRLLKEIYRNGDKDLYDEIVSEYNQQEGGVKEVSPADPNLRQKPLKTEKSSTDTAASNRNQINDVAGYKPNLAADLAAWNSQNKSKPGKIKHPYSNKTKGVDVKVDAEPYEISPDFKRKPDIDWEGIGAEVETEIAQEKATEKEATKETAKTEETPAEETEAAEATDKDNTTQDYIDSELGLLDNSLKDRGGYDKSNFKKKLPIDAISGMALGLIGNEQAKNADIPLRTEQVSEAVKNYTAELAKRSKEGLPVEVEAAMKNQLAEAYQGGLENIRNASGGNRATILGNQGGLEVAKHKGLVDIQLADYEAKERAFQQYGQAIQYINDFDSRREIANTTMRQQQGLMKQAEGKALATAGFAKLTEDLKYQRENGPGSANHMYRSKLMQEMYGFDPEMKDNGKGDTPGTRSYFEKQGAQLKERKGMVLNFEEKFHTLNGAQQQVVNDVMKTNGDFNKVAGLMDYMKDNPDINVAELNMDNIDQAIQKDNWGLLSMDREQAVKTAPGTKQLLASPEEKATETDPWKAKWEQRRADFLSGKGITSPEAPKVPTPEEAGVGTNLGLLYKPEAAAEPTQNIASNNQTPDWRDSLQIAREGLV